MLKNFALSLGLVAFGGILAACGGEEDSAKKVEDPKENTAAVEEEEEGSGFESLEGKKPEEITAEDWEKVDLSKKQFDKFLKGMTEPDEETGEININKAEMTDDKTIELTLNNSDGDTLENSMTAPFMDAFIREFYKHSDYYKDEEPTIIVKDLSGFKIMENNKPLEFDELGEEATGKDLGTFKLGEKVDIAGTVITVNKASYTDERNEYDDYKPAEVLRLDLTVQNSTEEELYFDVYEFELYDAEGTKMDMVSLDNMSESLQPGKNASGSAFIGASGKGPYELYYTDFVSGSKAMWQIDVK